MTPLESPFGARVKNARLAKRLTLAQAANSLEMSIGYLSDIENGRRLPLKDTQKIDLMEKILGFEEGELQRLARVERANLDLPPDIKNIFNDQCDAAVTVMREAEEMGLDKALELLRRKKEGGD